MNRDSLTLPAPVRDRLMLDNADPVLRGVTCFAEHAGSDGRLAVVEERTTAAEIRAADDGTFGLHGYASVTGVWYDVAGGAPYGFAERIAPGAFRKALSERDDVRLLLEHQGLPLARTSSGTMTLAEDEHGLLVDAPSLDARNPRAAELRSVIERGDADQMSFAFQVIRQDWNDDYTERTIREARLFDVSVVAFPANPATVVALRHAAGTVPDPTLDPDGADLGADPIDERAGLSLTTARAYADAARLRAASRR